LSFDSFSGIENLEKSGQKIKRGMGVGKKEKGRGVYNYHTIIKTIVGLPRSLGNV